MQKLIGNLSETFRDLSETLETYRNLLETYRKLLETLETYRKLYIGNFWKLIGNLSETFRNLSETFRNLVWYGLVYFDVLAKPPGLYLLPELRYPWFGLVWFGMLWYGMVLHGIVHGYCLDLLPRKIWRS